MCFKNGELGGPNLFQFQVQYPPSGNPPSHQPLGMYQYKSHQFMRIYIASIEGQVCAIL